jgi:hypothetical protein
MRQAARGIGADDELVRLRLRKRDEPGHIVDTELRRHREHHAFVGKKRDRNEIAVDVERQLVALRRQNREHRRHG